MKSKIPGIILICLGVVFFIVFQGRPLGMLAVLVTIVAGLILLAKAMKEPDNAPKDKS
jgi:hypothetical protein